LNTHSKDIEPTLQTLRQLNFSVTSRCT